MSENPEIGMTIDDAILRVDESMGQSGPSQSMRPLNHELYYQPQEGQVPRDDSPVGMKRNISYKSDSDSSQKSESDHDLSSVSSSASQESEDDVNHHAH